jgi:hypothetical protein
MITPVRHALVTAALVASAIVVAAVARPVPLAQAPQLDPLPYFIDEGDTRTGYEFSDHDLAIWALERWARTADPPFSLRAVPEREALVRLYWDPPDDGSFGEMRPIAVGGREGAEVFVRAKMEALGPELAERAKADPLWRDTIVYLTCLHELGHAMGLSHTADERDIMYFFGYGGDIVEFFGRYRRELKQRTDIRSVAGLSDADVARLHALRRRR